MRCVDRRFGCVRCAECRSGKTLHSLRLRRLPIQASWICAYERRPAGLHQELLGEERRHPGADAHQAMIQVLPATWRLMVLSELDLLTGRHECGAGASPSGSALLHNECKAPSRCNHAEMAGRKTLLLRGHAGDQLRGRN